MAVEFDSPAQGQHRRSGARLARGYTVRARLPKDASHVTLPSRRAAWLALSLLGAACSDVAEAPDDATIANDAATARDVAHTDTSVTHDTITDAPDGSDDDAPASDGGCAPTCTGQCTLGRCAVVLAMGPMNPYGIAVNASHIYWTMTLTRPGVVMRAPLDGSRQTASLASRLDSPHAIVLDATSVYWTDYVDDRGGVMKMPLDGIDGDPITPLALNQDYCHALAISGSELFFTNFAADTDDGTVSKMAIDGSGLTVLASGLRHPTNIAVDATHVYWTRWVAGGSVMKVPRNGGAPVEIVGGQNHPYGIAVDATYLYWTTTNGGTVMKKPLAGGEPQVLAFDQVQTFNLTIDETSVYFTTFDVNTGTGTVKKVPLAGGEVTTLSTESQSYNVAVDETSVYFTKFVKGDIVKLTPK